MVKVEPNGVTVVDRGRNYYLPMSKISSVYVTVGQDLGWLFIGVVNTLILWFGFGIQAEANGVTDIAKFLITYFTESPAPAVFLIFSILGFTKGCPRMLMINSGGIVTRVHGRRRNLQSYTDEINGYLRQRESGGNNDAAGVTRHIFK